MVDSVNGGFVTAFGVGLVGGNSGEEETFTVVAKQGTASELSFLPFFARPSLSPLTACSLACLMAGWLVEFRITLAIVAGMDCISLICRNPALRRGLRKAFECIKRRHLLGSMKIEIGLKQPRFLRSR